LALNLKYFTLIEAKFSRPHLYQGSKVLDVYGGEKFGTINSKYYLFSTCLFIIRLKDNLPDLNLNIDEARQIF